MTSRKHEGMPASALGVLPRYLRFTIALTGASAAGCGGATATASTTTASTTAANTAPSSAGSAPNTSVADNGVDVDPTAPCRCSWETNSAAAPRLCKKGETSHDGRSCVARSKTYPHIMKGPLPPPELGHSAPTSTSFAAPRERA